MNQIISKVKSTVQNLDENAQVILYGSRARGDFKKGSDWDFLILLEKELNEKLEEEIRNGLYEIELEVEEVISPIIENNSKWKTLNFLPFYQNILKEGKKL